MAEKKPYQIIKNRHVTEKATVLGALKNAKSNVSLSRCKSPKYVFIVDRSSNKQEIAGAVEELYKDQDIKVESVNTINVKAKARRVRGRQGFKNAFKKAIVTLRPGDDLDNV